MGRSALFREDRGQSDAVKWDVGIGDKGTVEGFTDPPYKIDVKIRRPTNSKRRSPVGMHADRLGFGEPESVIWGCVQEQDGSLPDGVNGDIPGTLQLDEIAANIWQWVESRYGDR